MKKFLSFWMIFCCLFITNAFGAGEFSLWSGVSSIGLKSVDGAGSIGTRFASESCTYGATLLGACYMQDICNDWKIGARASIAASKVHLLREAFSSIEGKSYPKEKIYFDTDLKAAMIGGSYNKSVSEKINLNGKLFFGCSFIYFSPQGYSAPFVSTKRATCFIAELSTGIQYLFTKKFGIGFDVGYRFTPEIEVSEAIKLNFSGVTGALNLSYKV
jgi:hypothetical protein